jgi:hypothetical protein
MPQEVGGRADKLGNRYEGRWVVKQLLRVINEEIYSIIVEAVGPEEEGVDVWVFKNDGSRECQQCKVRNASEELWSIGDLNRKGILKKSKIQLDANTDTTYALVSPLSCTMLTDLHQRAITGDNEKYFYEHQIKNSGKKLNVFFEAYCKYMNINVLNEKDLNKVYDYLRRTQYYQYPDDRNEKMNLLCEIGRLFVGDSDAVYSLISEYCLEQDLLGKQITGNMLLSYLKEKGINPRNLALDTRILPRINTLNQEFKESFSPVNNVVIDREEVKICLEEIEKGNSIVIHGKAGSGKSGCVYKIIEELEKKEILSLALKLDRRVPNQSAQKYGDSLGLPASPSYCLYELSRSKRSVLILDQLDAIRWTNSHSSTAIEVCKEIIRQVRQLNQDKEKNISVIFVCRTYDYVNDKGIKSLFKETDSKNEIVWREIIVGELSDNVVKDIVGVSYDGFSSRMKEILRIVNNLYIWTQLDKDERLNEIKSSTDLIKSWWEQLMFNYEKINQRSDYLNELKNEIVSKMEKSGRLVVPESIILKKYSPVALQYLISQGLLKVGSRNIMFVHQSFFDYFLVETMLEDIYDGISILEVIGEPDKQTPMRRYQIQMLLQILQGEDFDLFIELGKEIIEDENIRFYMKYVYLEVLGQSNIMTGDLKCLLKKYIYDSRYNEYFYEAVFRGNKIFIMFLINEGYITKWLEDNEKISMAVDFMASVCEFIQGETINIITPLLFKDKETDYKLYNCFPRDIIVDSDDMFSLRIRILEIYPELISHYYNFKELSRRNFKRALLILRLIVEKCKDKRRSDLNSYVEEIFEDIENMAIEDGEFAIQLLLPLVPEGSDYYDDKLNGWINRYGKVCEGGRACVSILKKAMKYLIENEVETFLSLLNQYRNYNLIIINEIFIETLIYLPETFADEVLNWLISGNGCHLLNRTGIEEDQLLHSKMILTRFSKYCDVHTFKKVEDYIVSLKEEDAKYILMRRINYFKDTGEHVYWSFWGEMQYSLLPALDKDRLSNSIRNLIKVLSRKFENQHKKYNNLSSHCGTVRSSISLTSELFSNRTWKKIILNNKVPKSDNSKWITAKQGFYESSVREFAQTLEYEGKKNPTRFAHLALELPDEISDSYIGAFISIVGSTKSENIKENNEIWSKAPIELAEKVIVRFRKGKEKSYDSRICWSIYNRSSENWSEDIIKLICDIAINNSNPKENEVIVTNAEDREMVTYDMLLSNSINSTRGIAAVTLGKLLWNNLSIYKDVKRAVESLIKDKHPAVRMASIECLCPIYNTDREWAKEKVIELFESDIRIAAHTNSYKLVHLIYKDYKDRLCNIIRAMFYSKDKDVCKAGARYICNLNILHGDFNDLIFSKEEFNIHQKKGIIEIAVYLFDKDNYTETCKKILNRFINDDTVEIGNMYSRLFFDKKLIIERDSEFIFSLFKESFSRRNLHFLVEFLQESGDSVLELADIILSLCKQVIDNYNSDIKKNPYGIYGIEDELSKLIVGLYDEAVNKDNELSLRCLDIWDQMFKYQVGSVRVLSKTLMDC